MSVSTLTLALATCNELGVHVVKVSKDNNQYYHLYYNLHGTTRVMLVPKKVDSAELLQYEVGLLLTRSVATQHEVGKNDAQFN